MARNDNQVVNNLTKMELMGNLERLNQELKTLLDKASDTDKKHQWLMGRQLYHATEIVLGIHGGAYWYLAAYFSDALVMSHEKEGLLNDGLFRAIKGTLQQLKEYDLQVVADD